MKKLLLTLSLILGIHTNMAIADITPTQLHATMGIVTNFILDDAIAYHGKSYKTVTSPYTGRVWLDRNLGASKVCTSFDDALCYGDYYQWGRGYDGHQDENSTVTTTLVTNINNAGSDFVIGSNDWTSADSNGQMRVTSWLKTDGTSVCPVGFRMPTIIELKAETLDANVTNRATAFTNFLKLPSAGYRSKSDGSMGSEGTSSYMWSGSISSATNSYFIHAGINSANEDNGKRNWGFPVRCIEKIKPEEHIHNGTAYGVVTSPYTGKVWLDRNLGANRVCTSLDDPQCYGDYYQWGRNFDGHQDENSATTTTLATDINNAGGNFVIVSNDWTSSDSNGSQRSANWLKTDGSSVCPVGFRVPITEELKSETIDQGVTDNITVFNNFLKLPSAGNRYQYSGSLVDPGLRGYVWTSSVDASSPHTLTFYSTNALIVSFYGDRSDGLSVRCIKD